MWDKKRAENFNLLLAKKERNEPVECNDREFLALLQMRGRISHLKNNDQPADWTFQQSLKMKLLTNRAAAQTDMKSRIAWPNLAALALPKSFYAAVSAFVLVAVLTTSLFYWFQPGKNNPDGPLAGFSKLIISPANAMDNFDLKPLVSDSLGAAGNSDYVLTSKEPVDQKLIKENLKLEPNVDYSLVSVSPTEWRISLKKELPANSILKVGLATAYNDKAGKEQSRDYAWAYQVKDSFKVLSTIPRNAANFVPANTGIEVIFSHENFVDAEKNFSIEPKVEGRFEKHGRTLVFVPKEALKLGTIYTVKVSRGVALSGTAETLPEDKVFSFETSGGGGSSFFEISNKIQEIKTTDIPRIELLSYGSAQGNIKVNIYKYDNWQNYLASLKERDKLPYWAYSKDNYRQDTSKLSRISTFETDIKVGQYVKFVEFSNRLPAGQYLVELVKDSEIKQAWLQVADISAYLNITKTKSIVWVNDLKSKSAITGATVEALDANLSYQTDGEGLAVFETPALLNYIRINSGSSNLIMPTARLSIGEEYFGNRTYDWRSGNVYNPAQDYWEYFYNDKTLYQTTDTIKFWGLLRPRDGGKMDKTVVMTLYKEGYMDYAFQPVNVAEQVIKFNENGIYSGEFKLENLRPDYYAMQLKVGDQIISTKYLTVKAFTKPNYQLSLTPDRKVVFDGETVNLTVKATYFEGTPVANLDLVLDSNTELKTNENGEVKYALTANAGGCYDQYYCGNDYQWLSVKPKQSELAEISGETTLQIMRSVVQSKVETKYPANDQVELSFATYKVDVTRANKEGNDWEQEKDLKVPAPNTTLEVQLIKRVYVEREVGEYYDFISKKVVKKYDYTEVKENAGNFNVKTDANGKYILRSKIDPKVSYDVLYRTLDANGKTFGQATYLYSGNRVANENFGDEEYSLQVDGGVAEQRSIGDNISLTFRKGNKEVQPKSMEKFLFMKLQNGLKSYAVSRDSKYQFTFASADVPSINIIGVYFNGATYIEKGVSNVHFKATDRQLNLKVTTDKATYKPGETAKLAVEVTDKSNKPVAAELNLNLVDEAIFAISNDAPDPLGSIYRGVPDGVLYSGNSHKALVDKQYAEGGGCFTAGTKISMADGTEKPIEKIVRGDKVMTLSDPITKEKVSGEVGATFEHLVKGYLIINNELRVTPEHLVYSNLAFRPAGKLKVGDWLLRLDGSKEIIKTIETEQAMVKVYNFRVDPQHTYIAEGFYVHNDKDGGARELFVDAPLFASIKTSADGRVSVPVKLPDNLTSWRVTAQAVTSGEIQAGVSQTKIPVSLPVFAEVTIGKQYLSADSPVARLRAFGTALTAKDQVNFSVGWTNQSSPAINIGAFKSAFYPLPKLSAGKNDIVYNLKSAKGDDAIKLPINIVESNLMKKDSVVEALTTNTVVTTKNNQAATLVFSDSGQGAYYSSLQDLTWSWGDRVDQLVARKTSRELLNKYFNEDILPPRISSAQYQDETGGLALLPYSSADLELTANIAAVNKEDFDQLALKSYFFSKLEGRASNQTEVSMALYGLASMNEPVLVRINAWLNSGKKFTITDKLYLAMAVHKLGADEWARTIYSEVIGQYGKTKGPDIVIQVDENKDNVLANTAQMVVLAGALSAPEQDGLWHYVNTTYSKEVLTDLSKLTYMKEVLPRLKVGPAKVAYELRGERKEFELKNGSTYAMSFQPSDAGSLKFLLVEGNISLAVNTDQRLNLSSFTPNKEIGVRREYWVGGKQVSKLKDTDMVEVRLYPNFKEGALDGYYQLTDYLPSGLAPVTKYYTGESASSCNYRYPYNTDGQKVTYLMSKNWRGNDCSDYFKYYARVVTRGTYKAEPAIMQSTADLSIMNYSNAGQIIIE